MYSNYSLTKRRPVIFRRTARLLIAIAALFAISTEADAQGFGGLTGRKKMIIKRLLPPAVNLTRKRIAVVSEAQGGVRADVAAVLKTRVITAIQRDPNFIVDDTKPETRLSFKVTTFRTEQVQVKDTSTNPPTTCTVFVGRADVSYQAIEVQTGIPQDSENLGWSIEATKPAHAVHEGVTSGLGKVRDKMSFWKKAPGCGSHGKASQSEAVDELYDELVHQVTQRAAPVDEEVEVGLPGGKLKDLAAIAADSRWAVLLEKAEQMPKLEKPEDDAARLYMIALAHEAMAYDARREAFELERRRVSGVGGDDSRDAQEKELKFFRTAKGHLESAAQFYREAISANRDEKEFRRPEARIEYAVRLYATIERQRTEYEVARQKIDRQQKPAAAATARARSGVEQPKQPAVPAATPTKPVAQTEVTGPNAEVIKLCVEKLDEATVLDFIANSTEPFDLSATGLVSLKRSCGDSTGKYAAAMRAKMTPKPKPRPAAKPKAATTLQ